MTSIVLRPFGGMIPRRGEKHLPSQAATDAENCILLSGELRPLHEKSKLAEFYPGFSHAENTAKFQGNVQNPWADYEEYFDTNFNNDSLRYWVAPGTGWTNSATGANALALAWNDYNASRGLTGEPILDEANRYLLFEYKGKSPAVLLPPDWTWFTDTPPVPSQYYSGAGGVITDWGPEFGINSWNCLAEGTHPVYVYFPPGWPVDFYVRTYDMYGLNTETGGPTVDPPHEVDYIVRDNGAVVAITNIENDASDAFVDFGEFVGTVAVNGGFVSLQAWAFSRYRTPVGPGEPDTYCKSELRLDSYTPHVGSFAINPYGLFIQNGSLGLVFKYEKFLDGFEVNSQQALLLIGATGFIVTGAGDLYFINGNQFIPPVFMATLTPGQEYHAVATVETITSQYESKFYLDGVKVVDQPPGVGNRWRPNSGNITVGRLNMAPTAFSAQQPVLSQWGQSFLTDQVLTEQQVLDLYNLA